ncbi:MAG: hypothetical protein JSV44_09960 [Candidatus Zixiibacteriota bacterium]|nr:MAG: hypothetical protein JSV44_09960 [candidate division Zixibacteria bacterium]
MKCSILQYKLDRMYFSLGSEANIFPDCRFVVFRDSIPVIDGAIEIAQPGISISYPLHRLIDTANLHIMHAVIDAATIDSTSEIIIGAAEFDQISLAAVFPVLKGEDSIRTVGSIYFTQHGNPLEWRRFESLFEMNLAYSGGALDGYFSYSAPQLPAGRANYISTQAPYFIALAPNVAREFNHNGLLTTSLYYRFDPEKSYIFFGGDRLEPQYCLYLNDSTVNRTYAYNSEAGRRLMQSVRGCPRKLALYAADGKLEQTGAYFGDILSRDKMRTEFVSSRRDADIYFLFVPLNKKDTMCSLKFIYDFLVSDTAYGHQINKTVALIGNYLESAENAASARIYKYYLGKIDRALREDIGVFPLFRPTLYFVAGTDVQDYTFDSNGYMDLKQLSKIRLPGVAGRQDQ